MKVKTNYKKSIIGSSISFLVATSCCWLPALLLIIGEGSTQIGISNGLEKLCGVSMAIGAGLLGLGVYQFTNRKNEPMNKDVVLQSIFTGQEYGYKKEETMPTDAYKFLYECENCKKNIKTNK